MSKKTGRIAIAALAVSIVLIIALLACKNATSFENRLEKEMEYEEILLRFDEYALVRIDGDTAAFVCRPGAKTEYEFNVYAEIDLNTHRATVERCISRNSGIFSNDFAEQARQEHHAYSDFYGRKGIGPPPYKFYMGISTTEPSYEILGPGTSELSWVELEGMYYFMFLEDRA